MSTWTYDLATLIGQVRLLISDNDIVPVTDAHFSDEEIQVFLTMAGNSTYLAAALALKAWVASLASTVASERIGDYSYSSGLVANKVALAENYLKINAAIGSGLVAMDYAEMDLNAIGEVE